MQTRLHTALVWTHRWAGLTVGVILTVVCVSGSALLFQRQFWEWTHGGLTPPDMAAEVGSIDRWIENGRAALPDLGPPIAVWAPHVDHNQSRAGMLIFAGRPPGGLGNMGFAAVLVAPASGDVLGVIDVDRTPAYAALFLHRDLWTGETGRVVSGVMAVGTLLLLVIGTYLWWPSTARLGRKLSGRPWRITLTRSRPLHDWVGVWTLALLTILVVSGLALVQPSWVAPVLDAVAGPEPETVAAVDAPCAAPIGFDAALARAQALAPSNGFKSLYPVDAEFRRWEIVLEGDDPDAGSDDTHVAVDTRCGTVAVEGTPATRSAHEAAELWLSDAHDGVAFGAAGPVLVSLCGLSPLVLLWSGILMWNRGRHARRKTALRRGESVAS